MRADGLRIWLAFACPPGLLSHQLYAAASMTSGCLTTLISTTTALTGTKLL